MGERIDTCAAHDNDGEDVIRFDHVARTLTLVRDQEGNNHGTAGPFTHEEIQLFDGMIVEAMTEGPMPSSICDGTTAAVEIPPACGNLQTFPAKVENGREFLES